MSKIKHIAKQLQVVAAPELTPSAVAEVKRVASTVSRLKQDFKRIVSNAKKMEKIPSYMLDDISVFAKDLENLDQYCKWLKEKTSVKED